MIDIKQITVMFLALMLCMSAYAHQTDREIMLQIENDELVLRLADVLIENRRLEKFVNEALSAKKAGQKVVAGCNPKDLERKSVLEWGSNGFIVASRSEGWIRTNGPKCTVNQLNDIYDEISSYLSYPSESKKMLKYLINNRS